MWQSCGNHVAIMWQSCGNNVLYQRAGREEQERLQVRVELVVILLQEAGGIVADGAGEVIDLCHPREGV
eukprot:4684884-Prymnesium_polylepis.1